MNDEPVTITINVFTLPQHQDSNGNVLIPLFEVSHGSQTNGTWFVFPTESMQDHMHDHKSIRASKIAVDQLETLTSEELQQDSFMCVVCHDGENDSPVVRLPCNHLYHKNCVEAWLDKKNSCPMCRTELPTDCPFYNAVHKLKLLLPHEQCSCTVYTGRDCTNKDDRLPLPMCGKGHFLHQSVSHLEEFRPLFTQRSCPVCHLCTASVEGEKAA